ncbi:MAG: hypothetical protein ABIF92_01370, partial [archaeon]
MKINRKAQAEMISFVLIALIVVVLVLTSYIWGSGVLSDQQDSYSTSRMKSKMLEIREAIMAVAQEGENATRVLQVHIDRGRLYLDTDFTAVSCGSARTDNGLIFEADTKDEIVSSNDWISIDPYENDTGDLCTTGGPSLSYPAVLLARSADVGEGDG